MTLRFGLPSAAPVSLALIGLALLASACSGKGVEGTCPDGAACGGSPVGNWVIAGNCEFKANRQDQPLQPNEQVALPVLPVLTSSPIAATTLGDQCSQLIYAPVDTAGPNTRIKSVNLWHDAPALASGRASFNADSTYSIALQFGGYYESHFSPYCVQAAGANPSCVDLAANLAQFYLEKATVDAAGNKSPDFANIVCQPASDGGCDCGYDYQVALTDKGTWHSAGAYLTQSSDPSGYALNNRAAGSQGPTTAMGSTLCQNGDQLTLSGYDGAKLFHTPGLRVLTLLRQP